MKANMETKGSTFAMVQKYPDYRVLSYDHPCVTNTFPTYIEKKDKYLKIKNTCSSQESRIMNNKDSINDSAIPQESLLNSDDNIDGPTMHDMPGLIDYNIVPEDTPLSNDQDNQFNPNERFTGDSLLHYDVKAINDLVMNLIPAGEITLLAGPGDTGKTTFYFHLAISITTKKQEFISRRIHSKYSSVLIIATEDSKRRIAEKVQKQMKNIAPDAVTLNDLVVHVTGEDLINRLRKELTLKSFDLVVLDALGDLLQGDINSQSEVRNFYEQIEKLIREFKTTFLVIHHVNKTPGNSGRGKILGSVAIVDRARNVLMLSKDAKTGIRSLTIEKSNNLSDALKGKPIRLRFDNETLTYSIVPEYIVNKDIDSEKLTSVDRSNTYDLSDTTNISKPKGKKGKPGRKLDENKVKIAIELYEQGLTLEEIGEKVGKNKTTICRWLKSKRTDQ